MKNWLYKVIWLMSLTVITCFSLSAHKVEQTQSENWDGTDSIAASKMICADMKACLHHEGDTNISEATFCEEQETVYLLTEEERYLLAKIAMAEAESEDTEGKALVICVVLNRTSSSVFPDRIEDVLYQKNQFSPIANGRFETVEPDQDCWDALQMVEHGWDESQGALYFENGSASGWHRNHLQFLFQYGNHYFYRERTADE